MLGVVGRGAYTGGILQRLSVPGRPRVHGAVGHAGVAGRIGFRELVWAGLRAGAIVHEEAVRADELRRHWRQGPDFQLS